MKVNIETGGLRFSGGNGEGVATLHASNRELKTKVQHFDANDADKREAFNTIDFTTEGGGLIMIFLSDGQLEALAGTLAAEVAGRYVTDENAGLKA
jgi:hypothetical protein